MLHDTTSTVTTDRRRWGVNATTVKEEVGDECDNGEGGRAAVEYDDDGGRTETTTRAGAGTRGGGPPWLVAEGEVPCRGVCASFPD